MTYNDQYLLTGQEYYDIDEKPVEDNILGIASYSNEYDDRGNLTAITYFDRNDRITGDRDSGIAAWKYTYDELDRLIDTKLLNADGNLRENQYGIAGCRIVYGEDGEVYKRIWYDSKGQETEIIE
ncbi:MAG: hypothetical protein JXA92_12245 [candidate division Zixibacteria bacterium]|nr:hypothetical protein [candidate division Zixibacteria bacterium]